MSELEAIKDEVNGISRELSGLRPLVNEMHSNMPRIAKALETLAGVSVKLEANAEDHKRLHYRITDNEEEIERVESDLKELKRDFYTMRDEHVVVTTARKTKQQVAQSSVLARLRLKAAEKAVELITLAVMLFSAWMVLSHLPKYSPAAQIMSQAGQEEGLPR